MRWAKLKEDQRAKIPCLNAAPAVFELEDVNLLLKRRASAKTAAQQTASH